MSDYASAAEQARRAFASVERIERALRAAPNSVSLQINLAAKQKLARRMQENLLKVAELMNVEVCNYRILPEFNQKYHIKHVSESLISYQNLFSQIFDALKHGKKARTGFGLDVESASRLEFGYSYSGSLGIVMLYPSEKDLFGESLDKSIEAMLRAMEMRNQGDVRVVANTLGLAVVKRVHDWSQSNLKSGFAVDVRWNRSDGRQVGRVIDHHDFNRIVWAVSGTSDTTTTERYIEGLLVGLNLKVGNFHFVVPNGEDVRGPLAEEFERRPLRVGARYRALIREQTKLVYATNAEISTKYLVSLEGPVSGVALERPS